MMKQVAESSSDEARRVSDSISDDSQGVVKDNITSSTPRDHENRAFTPPPRIAARFYRPTATRRKSSAASSRRNSISSAHSHQSHKSYHGGPQSNHVAQHLRRASIIEDRKARLADRAAHAEKVRLRAALAKAAPRSTNNSEERALAAQQAREKNLAEIVASCAEEVKRAKGIAESMKEKREAENKKMRREMQERLAEAEKRRDEILSRSNGKRGRSASVTTQQQMRSRKSLSPMVEVIEAPSETIAARRIQNQWRVYQRYKTLKEFADLNISIDSVRDTSFDDVVTLLAEEKVLLGTAKILRVCGLKEGESGSVNEMTAVRTFLIAFLILGHPAQVLNIKGSTIVNSSVVLSQSGLGGSEQEQDLIAKARDLLISFENVLPRLTTANHYTPPPTQLSTLSESYATFFNAFIAWKARDSNTLIDMMVLQFVELDSIWQTVKDSTEEAVTETYRDGIRENQLKLMVRIKRLAGPVAGKRLITNAIRESRKARATKQTGDIKPRNTNSGASAGSLLGDLALSAHSVSSHLQTLTPPATPQRVTSQNSHADQLRTAKSAIPDNRVVIHELAIDKEYRIALDDCLEQRLDQKRLIFDTMRNVIRGDHSDSDPWVLAMAENIRGKLLRLLQPGNSLHTLISEALDLEVISRELQTGGFSYERFFSFIASILPRLCAPVRDEEVKALINGPLQDSNLDVVTRLEALMRFIDFMHLDYANFMLRQSAPELIKHATVYEQKLFADDLDLSVHSLTNTEIWWRNSRNKVLAEVAKRDPERINLARSRPTPERFYFQMLTDLFTDLGSDTEIPETLRLDTKRISRIRSELRRIITAGAILLQSKNLLKRDVRSQWKTEAFRIISVLEGAGGPDIAREGIQAALESSRSMPMATKGHISELVRRIIENSYENEQSHSPIAEPVMRLLLTRLRGHILSRLSAISASEKIKATSTASEGLATLGLPEFVTPVGKIVEELGRVGVVDREAHAIWYEIVAKKVESSS